MFKYSVLTEDESKQVEENICPVCGAELTELEETFEEEIEGHIYTMKKYECETCGVKFALITGRIREFGEPEDVSDPHVGSYLQLDE